MLNLDWCNIIYKPEWLPKQFPLWDGNLIDKEEFLNDLGNFDYYFQLSHILPILQNKDQFCACSMKSGNHYNCGFRLGYDFFIYWDSNPTNKGLMMEFPSHGLDNLFEWLSIDRSKDSAFEDLCKKLWSIGCRFSRIDICKDIKKSDDYIFTPAKLCDLYLNGQIVTHCSNYDLDISGVQDARFIDTKSRGSTFYLGSLKNRRKLLRVYDKEAELEDEKYPYWRWEVELHGNYARTIQEKVIDGWDVSFADLIDSFCYIVEDSGDAKKCHRNVLEEWKLFRDLEFSEGIPSGVKCTPEAKCYTMEKKRSWERSIAPSIAAVLWCFPEDKHHYMNMLDSIDYFRHYCEKYGREDLLHDIERYRDYCN